MIKELTAEIKNVKPALQQTQCYVQPGLQLYAEDCLETLSRMSTGSVDLLLQDTPFGCTQNEWDINPNFEIMWQEWERVTKENAAMIFFGTQPFASELIMSNKKLFRYDLIWDKGNTVGHLNANRMPIRKHEVVLIFYRKLPTYNPQKDFTGKTYHSKFNLKSNAGGNNYGKAKSIDNSEINKNYNYPESILFFERDQSGLVDHPTQKPFDLIRYLVKTYSNENETVFDGYSGSGTTAAACIKEKRNFIGSEMNKDYFDMSVQRLSKMIMQPELF